MAATGAGTAQRRAALDPLAEADVGSVLVTVERVVVALVFENHQQPVAVEPADEGHAAGRHGADGGSGRCPDPLALPGEVGSAFFLPETGQHPALEGRLQAATLLCKGFVVAEVQRNVGQQVAERFQQCLQIALVALQLLQCGAAVADSGLKLGNDLAAVLAGCLKLAQHLLLLGAELLQRSRSARVCASIAAICAPRAWLRRSK